MNFNNIESAGLDLNQIYKQLSAYDIPSGVGCIDDRPKITENNTPGDKALIQSPGGQFGLEGIIFTYLLKKNSHLGPEKFHELYKSVKASINKSPVHFHSDLTHNDTAYDVRGCAAIGLLATENPALGSVLSYITEHEKFNKDILDPSPHNAKAVLILKGNYGFITSNSTDAIQAYAFSIDKISILLDNFIQKWNEKNTNDLLHINRNTLVREYIAFVLKVFQILALNDDKKIPAFLINTTDYPKLDIRRLGININSTKKLLYDSFGIAEIKVGVRINKNQSYTPLYLRQNGTKRFFDEEKDNKL